MGVQVSREKIVDFEQVTDGRKLRFWEAGSFGDSLTFQQQAGRGTHDRVVLNALPILKAWFEGKPSTVLEIGSGNGWSTKQIQDVVPLVTIIATDYKKHDPQYFAVEADLLSHEAVKKHPEADTLLIVCPPPDEDTYMCYYAIEEFRGDTLIFIGELGASDGESGLYAYLMSSDSAWTLRLREMVYETTSAFGDPVEKEIFIWSRIH